MLPCQLPLLQILYIPISQIGMLPNLRHIRVGFPLLLLRKSCIFPDLLYPNNAKDVLSQILCTLPALAPAIVSRLPIMSSSKTTFFRDLKKDPFLFLLHYNLHWRGLGL